MRVTIPEYMKRYHSMGGGNQKSFCQSEGIPYSQFHYQWRRFRMKPTADNSSGFIALKVSEKSMKKTTKPVLVTSVVDPIVQSSR